MTKIQEIIANKSLQQLENELSFQIKNGESKGGEICSAILQKITSIHQTNAKQVFKIQDLTFEPTQEFDIKQNSLDSFVEDHPILFLCSVFAFMALIFYATWGTYLIKTS